MHKIPISLAVEAYSSTKMFFFFNIQIVFHISCESFCYQGILLWSFDFKWPEHNLACVQFYDA